MLQIVLLAGKFIFLIILYLFLYRVIRSSTRDLRSATPGRVPPAQPAASYAGTAASVAPGAVIFDPRSAQRPATSTGGTWSLVVEKSPVLRAGETFTFTPGMPVLAGRSSDMDIHLEDTFVSSKHALFEARPTGLLVEDLLSTNGTQVNGSDISGQTILSAGDRVEVGDTIFRVEVR